MSYLSTTEYAPPGSERIRVLHVDDQIDAAKTAGEFLERESDPIEVVSETSANEGLVRLAEEQFDCVVSDYEMPGMDGLQFLRQLREDHPDLPFILYTGKGSEEIASDAISAGVTDYLQKETGTNQYTVLANRIENTVHQYRSQHAVEATEQKLLQLAENTDDILFLVDGDWEELLFINTAYEDIWGGSIADLQENPQSFLKQIHPDDRSKATASMKRLQNGEPDVIEYRVQADDGEYRWVRGESKPIFDSNGDVNRITGFVRDITKRKTREQELQAQVAALETATDGIAILNEVQEYVYMNDTHADIYGFDDPEQLLGESWRDCYDDADTDQFKDDILPVLFETGQWRGDMTVTTAGGQTIHQELSLTRLDDGRVVCVVRDVTEQKQRENELETVQRRFDAVLENTTTPMFMKDDDGAYIFVNQAYCDLFDLREGEIIGRTDHEIHAPEMAADVQKNDQAVIERGEPIETEEEIVVDGEERIFLSTKVPIYDTGERSDPDTPVAIFGVATDITDRKNAEQNLREEQQFVQSIFQSLPDPCYAVDRDGYPLRWNERLEDVTGYSSAEIEDMHFMDFLPDEEVESIVAKFHAVLDENQPLTADSAFETKDGSRIPYEFTGGPLEAADGTIRGVTGIGRDITERTARELQLKALNQIAQELMIAETKDEVIEIGVETTRDLLGLEANSIHLYDDDADGLVPGEVSNAVYDLVGEPPTFTDGDSIAWRVFQQGKTLAVDDVHEDPDRYNSDTPIRSELYLPLGQYGILLAGSSSPEVFDEQDVLMGEILAGALTTALEQVERTAQLRARERELTSQNDRLEEFTGIVSHDLRNPLTVAEGRLELAAAECDSDHLEHIEQAHERMRTLIEDLLSLAREGESVTDVEPVALASLVEGCWANVETGEATLVTDIDRTIHADTSRLKQLFENLMRNAIQHGGEEVTVTVGVLDDGFYFEDDGPGIPSDDRDDIFNAGYSTSEDGTGFGLSIVKQIVEAHDWQIRVTGGTEGGTRFEIIGIEAADQ